MSQFKDIDYSHMATRPMPVARAYPPRLTWEDAVTMPLAIPPHRNWSHTWHETCACVGLMLTSLGLQVMLITGWLPIGR